MINPHESSPATRLRILFLDSTSRKRQLQSHAQSLMFGYGDVWTWTAICAETKLVPFWLVAWRDGECAKTFVADLAGRLAHRVQITTDGLKAYVDAEEIVRLAD